MTEYEIGLRAACTIGKEVVAITCDAIQEEREACARIAEQVWRPVDGLTIQEAIAFAIRMRGFAEPPEETAIAAENRAKGWTASPVGSH